MGFSREIKKSGWLQRLRPVPEIMADLLDVVVIGSCMIDLIR